MADAVIRPRPWPAASALEPASARSSVARPGSGRPRPPDSLPLPFGQTNHLWLAIHLQDAAVLEAVAARCERFTSWVSLEPPDGVLLEVQGSRRLFGGLPALMDKIRQALNEQGVAVSMAVTPTPAGALWLARQGRPARVVERMEELPAALGRVPLACLRWPEEQTQWLAELGVATVSELMRLPRSGLAKRLGAVWVRMLDRALGVCEEPRLKFHAPQRFIDAIDPDDPVHTVERLEALMLPRLELLRDFLRGRQAAIGALSIRLLYGCRQQARPRTGLRIAPASPCADIERFAHLLRERLRRLRLPAPVVGVRMRSGPLFADVQASASLMRKTDARFRTDVQALPRLVERLRTRLGPQVLQGIRAAADRRPEKAWVAVNELSCVAGASLPPDFPRRPAWLRVTAQSLPKTEISQWTLERGPERIEGGWWDGADTERDYFIVRHCRGARLWVYRERHPPHGWYLQGWFG